MDEEAVKQRLKTILPPEKLLLVYNLHYPNEPPGASIIAAAAAGAFQPDANYEQKFYGLIYHPILLPLSTIPLSTLLPLNLAALLLPPPFAPDFPEQSLGLITILDQTRVLTGGTYNARYTRCFFDPLCERLARHLFLAIPEEHLRLDKQHAWMDRGYTFEQWLTRVFNLWAPLVHSDGFMVQHRQDVKDFLHRVRGAVEAQYGVTDPFAACEAVDDRDLTLFPRMIAQGAPKGSLEDPERELEIWDYAFWFIRIMNAHFALTDYCGHYPYATEWHGRELTNEDEEYMEKTGGALYDAKMKPVFEQVKKDVKDGVWQPMTPIEEFEGH